MGKLYNLKEGVYNEQEVVSANGTVVFPAQGRKLVVITKATAAAITLTAPTTGSDDFAEIVFVSTTDAAHTVTESSNGFNGGGAGEDVGTFGGAAGDGFGAIAYGGNAYTTHVNNVTFA